MYYFIQTSCYRKSQVFKITCTRWNEFLVFPAEDVNLDRILFNKKQDDIVSARGEVHRVQPLHSLHVEMLLQREFPAPVDVQVLGLGAGHRQVVVEA